MSKLTKIVCLSVIMLVLFQVLCLSRFQSVHPRYLTDQYVYLNGVQVSPFSASRKSSWWLQWKSRARCQLRIGLKKAWFSGASIHGCLSRSSVLCLFKRSHFQLFGVDRGVCRVSERYMKDCPNGNFYTSDVVSVARHQINCPCHCFFIVNCWQL